MQGSDIPRPRNKYGPLKPLGPESWGHKIRSSQDFQAGYRILGLLCAPRLCGTMFAKLSNFWRRPDTLWHTTPFVECHKLICNAQTQCYRWQHCASKSLVGWLNDLDFNQLREFDPRCHYQLPKSTAHRRFPEGPSCVGSKFWRRECHRYSIHKGISIIIFWRAGIAR